MRVLLQVERMPMLDVCDLESTDGNGEFLTSRFAHTPKIKSNMGDSYISHDVD